MSARITMLWRMGLCMLWLGLAAGCTKASDPSEVLVVVNSDLTLGEQLTRVDVEVYDANGQGLALQNASFTLAAEGQEGRSLPLSFSIAPSSEEDRRDFRVVITGFGRATAGAPLSATIEKQIISAFQPRRSVRLEVFLSEACLGKLCRDASGRRGDLTCNAAGECGAVPVETPDPPAGTDASAEDASTSDGEAPGMDASDGALDAGSDASNDADSDTPADATPDPDAGADAAETGPAPECDETHACSAGYACVDAKCVSKCLQTQCDPNATCSLLEGTPTCTCGSGFIQMSSGGTVTCVADVSCEQLGCHTNAMCVVKADQTRECVCKPGYTGTGKACAPVDCGAVTLANGTATPVNGVTTYGGTINYACTTGYVRSGAASAMCGADAKWSASATCNPVNCGTPTLTNGMAMLTGGTTTLGSGVMYTCNTGYNRSGSATGTCGANGSWSPVPTCNLVDCGNPPVPTRGSVSTTNANKYNSVASYSCTDGTLQGTQSRTCQANGTWSGSTPTCLYCGDGVVTTPGEQCDPAHPNWSYWTCSPQCARKTSYTACVGPSDCLNGEACVSGLGFCTTSCSVSSQCPVVTGGVTRGTCPLETNPSAYGICVAAQCRNSADCANGLRCYTGGNFPFCSACSPSDTCL